MASNLIFCNLNYFSRMLMGLRCFVDGVHLLFGQCTVEDGVLERLVCKLNHYDWPLVGLIP